MSSFLNWATSVNCFCWMSCYLLLLSTCYPIFILAFAYYILDKLIHSEEKDQLPQFILWTTQNIPFLFSKSYLWARGASKAGGEWRSLLTRFIISPARLGSKLPKDNTFSICETWASRSGTLLLLPTSISKKSSYVMNAWCENHFQR